MHEFLAWISKLLDSWKFWIVIAPWEIGVRVRLGRRAISLSPGLHWRIPVVDAITLVNTRLRIDAVPAVTIGAEGSNRTRNISATIGYRVADPVKAMLKFGLPTVVVVCKAQGEIAAERDEQKAAETLRKYFDSSSGISIEFVKFVEDVEVRTYRLINGGNWSVSGHESTGVNGTPSGRY